MYRLVLTNLLRSRELYRSTPVCLISTENGSIESPTTSTKLDKQTLLKLERLSGLQFRDKKEIDDLTEEIRLANQIFEVETKDVEPLYSIVEELIDCPLREDTAVKPNQDKIFENASEHVEGFFVAPPANIVVDESKTLKDLNDTD